MTSRILLAATIAAAGLLACSAASAQGAMTASIGVSIANDINEAKCQSGTHPVSKSKWDREAAKADKLMAAYVAAVAANDRKAAGKQFFASTVPNWKGADGPVLVGDSRDPFAGSAPATMTRVQLVVGDDDAAARGAWRLERAGPAGPQAYLYTVDFAGSFWTHLVWKIRAMRVTSPEDAPAMPPRFCHLEEVWSLM